VSVFSCSNLFIAYKKLLKLCNHKHNNIIKYNCINSLYIYIIIYMRLTYCSSNDNFVLVLKIRMKWSYPQSRSTSAACRILFSFHRGTFESCLLPARQQVVQVEEIANFAKVKRNRASSSFYHSRKMTYVYWDNAMFSHLQAHTRARVQWHLKWWYCKNFNQTIFLYYIILFFW